jgi:phosphate starvation-inducible PhoH-like protein
MSGLIEAETVLCGVEGISFVHFNERDVVRHPLVQRIVRAYETYSNPGSSAQQTLRFAPSGQGGGNGDNGENGGAQ